MTLKHKFVSSIAALAVFLYVVTGIYRVMVDPPIIYSGADRIEPEVLRAGDVFRVARSFSATRDAHIFISRSVVKGDCKKNCEILDISQGYSYIEKGDYFRWREHIMPSRAQPGMWTFLVTVQWQDMLGFTHNIKLKPLQIEVLR